MDNPATHKNLMVLRSSIYGNATRRNLGFGVALLVIAVASGCGLIDDAGRQANSVDDIARQIAQRTGGTSDDAARWLRTLGSTEDEALRVGEGMLRSSLTVTTGESRVGAWIDEAIASLNPEERARVRGVALAATCDALDAVVQGNSPDLASMVLNGVGSLSPAADQQLLRLQLNDMFEDLRRGGEATFAARTEILFACMVLDAE